MYCTSRDPNSNEGKAQADTGFSNLNFKNYGFSKTISSNTLSEGS